MMLCLVYWQEEQIALRKMEDEHRQRDRLRMQKERQRELTRNIKQKMKLRVRESVTDVLHTLEVLGRQFQLGG